MSLYDEPVQFNLGVLRSEITLKLHTVHASRIWRGRPDAEGSPRIIGLHRYITITNLMKHGSELDDPFSDWWMVRIEGKIEETRQQLQSLREQIQHVLDSVPPALSLGENLNVQPVELPLYVGSPLGFAAIHLLMDYDTLVRKLLLAHHIAVIKRSTLEFMLSEASHAMRSLFGMAHYYRYSGVNRGDCKAQNAAWLAAVAKYGMPPPGVITGEVRSNFAPPLRTARAARAAEVIAEAGTEDIGDVAGVLGEAVGMEMLQGEIESDEEVPEDDPLFDIEPFTP